MSLARPFQKNYSERWKPEACKRSIILSIRARSTTWFGSKAGLAEKGARKDVATRGSTKSATNLCGVLSSFASTLTTGTHSLALVLFTILQYNTTHLV